MAFYHTFPGKSLIISSFFIYGAITSSLLTEDGKPSFGCIKDLLIKKDEAHALGLLKLLTNVQNSFRKNKLQMLLEFNTGECIGVQNKNAHLNDKFCAASMVKMSTAYIFLKVLTKVRPGHSIDDILKLKIKDLAPGFCDKYGLEVEIGEMTVNDLLLMNGHLESYSRMREEVLIERELEPSEKIFLKPQERRGFYQFEWSDGDSYYALIALLIENLEEGATFENLFQRLIATPLELGNTHVPQKGRLSNFGFESGPDFNLVNMVGAANIITDIQDCMKLQSFLAKELDEMLGERHGRLIPTRKYGRATLKAGSYMMLPCDSGVVRISFVDMPNTSYSFYFATSTISIIFTSDKKECRNEFLSQLCNIYGVKQE